MGDLEKIDEVNSQDPIIHETPNEPNNSGKYVSKR
jgi:hypothetical protein